MERPFGGVDGWGRDGVKRYDCDRSYRGKKDTKGSSVLSWRGVKEEQEKGSLHRSVPSSGAVFHYS